jgi:hypothetical protein
MSMPDDKRKASPADRLHNILDADQTKKTPAVSRTYPKSTSAPNIHLPPPGKAEAKPARATTVAPAAVQPTVDRPVGGTLLPAFWTIASIISLLFNLVLVIVVVMLLQGLGSLDASGLGPGVLGGLYSNFQLMDAAHIKTTIPVQANIPLNLSIPVQTTTAISLAQAATIQGAHVRINTTALNIDAPATVTLPAGTTLSVVLGFAVPVQGQVPVSMTVPVDIAIHDTELHSPIQGLQDTIRPLYCMASPSAKSVTGEPVCK